MVSSVSDWEEKNNQLVKTFVFNTFAEAIGFMQKASTDIERLDHHPEWTNIYNRVIVKLCTHSVGNIVTDKDWELAKVLDEVSSLTGS